MFEVPDRLSKAIEDGRQDYRDFKPRPPMPPENNAGLPWTEEQCRWVGWMLGRADEISLITNEVRYFTENGENIIDRRIRKLDVDHGLSPFRDR